MVDMMRRKRWDVREGYANFHTNTNGYEIWQDGVVRKSVGVHQLLAICNGANPNKVFSNGDWHIHHKNGVSWDNRDENIEILDKSEHAKHHRRQDALNDGIDERLYDKDSVEELYWGQGMSRGELAEELNTTVDVVKNWLDNHNLRWDQYWRNE